MNIFVTKLNSSTKDDDLRDLFAEYGEVTSAKVIIDRETGYSKGFGFVEMSNDSEAKKAIDELNETEFQSRTIIVKEARPKTDSYGGGGGGNRGGYNKGGNRGGGGGYNSRY